MNPTPRLAVLSLLLSAPCALTSAADAPVNPPPVVIERAPESERGSDAAALRAEVRRLSEQLAAERKRADDADARFATVTAGVDRLMQEKSTLQAQFDQTKAREDALREKLEASTKAASTAVAADGAKLLDLQRQLEAAQARQRALFAENDALKAAAGRQPAGDKAGENDARLKETQEKLETAQRSLAQLQAAAAGHDEQAAEVEHLRGQVSDLQAKLTVATAPRPDNQAAKLAETEYKLETALRTYSQLQAENQQLKAAAAGHAAESQEAENLRRQLAELQSKLNASGAQPRPEDAAKLADAENKLAAALRSYSQLQAENEQLKAAAAGHVAQNTELENLRRQVADLQSKLSAASTERPDDATAKLADTQGKLETALRSFSQLQTENDRLKASAASETELRSQLEALRRENAAMTAKLDAQPAPAAPSPDLSDRLAQTEDKLNTVLRSYTLLQRENDQLKETAERTSREAQAASAHTTSETAAQMSALFDELRQARAQGAALAAENSDLKTRLALASRPITGLLASPVRPGTPEAAAATSRTVAPPVAGGARTHVVVEGDTLAKISRAYYGTANRWDEILAANRGVIRDENVLPLGTTLRIP